LATAATVLQVVDGAGATLVPARRTRSKFDLNKRFNKKRL